MLLPLLQPTLATFFRGVPVITRCVALICLPAKIIALLQGVEMGTGQHWYVPLMVAKGARAGKTIALVAELHGDELSSIRTVAAGHGRTGPQHHDRLGHCRVGAF